MFCVREKDRFYAAYRDFGYFTHSLDKSEHSSSSTVFLEREFEEGSCDDLLDFFSMLGKAKVAFYSFY
jgi:hypothetical protein